MTKKEVRKLAQQKIKEGKTQQQTFEEIKEISDRTSEEIANIVKAIPTLELRKKNKTMNTILIGLLALTVVFKMIAGIPIIIENGIQWLPIIFVLPIINILMLLGISTYSPRAHSLTGLFSFLAVLRSLVDIIGNQFDPLVLIDFAIIGAIIFLGFYLQAKLTPGYTTIKEKYTNNQGQTRLRNKIVFNDKH